MNLRKPVVAGVLLAMTLAACGGEDAESSTTTEATSTTVPSTTTTEPVTSTSSEESSVTFVGADGVETVIDDTSRIVSLNGDITEIIYELGLGDQVVAVDVTTTYPEQAAAKNEAGDTVGFHQQLSAEAVLRFAPTVVIGDTQVAPTEVIDQLRESGVPVVIIEYQTTLDGVATKINQVAEILGVPDEGKALADRVSGEIAEARQLAEDIETDPKVAYVYLRGPQVVFLFGAGMPTQAMIEGAGAVDAGVESGVFGPVPLTPEALIAAAPEVVVLPEAGLEALGGTEAFEALPGVSETPAAASDSYLVYDEAYFFNLGPRTGEALLEFIEDLYPELGG